MWEGLKECWSCWKLLSYITILVFLESDKDRNGIEFVYIITLKSEKILDFEKIILNCISFYIPADKSGWKA